MNLNSVIPVKTGTTDPSLYGVAGAAFDFRIFSRRSERLGNAGLANQARSEIRHKSPPSDPFSHKGLTTRHFRRPPRIGWKQRRTAAASPPLQAEAEHVNAQPERRGARRPRPAARRIFRRLVQAERRGSQARHQRIRRRHRQPQPVRPLRTPYPTSLPLPPSALQIPKHQLYPPLGPVSSARRTTGLSSGRLPPPSRHSPAGLGAVYPAAGDESLHLALAGCGISHFWVCDTPIMERPIPRANLFSNSSQKASRSQPMKG